MGSASLITGLDPCFKTRSHDSICVFHNSTVHLCFKTKEENKVVEDKSFEFVSSDYLLYISASHAIKIRLKDYPTH